jgi:hypothetical protein
MVYGEKSGNPALLAIRYGRPIRIACSTDWVSSTSIFVNVCFWLAPQNVAKIELENFRHQNIFFLTEAFLDLVFALSD